jgi:tRNA(Ile)-lysidine synthase TilS/MesJ
MKELFHTASNEELYSRKSLERASTICTTCISFVRFSCLRTALEKDIPLVVFGFNPGQMPEGAAIVKTNAALLRSLQQSIYGPISAIVKDEARAFFLEEKHFTSGCRFPHIANPFAFVDYEEERIYTRIRQVGWQQVADTDENSTNCLLNSYANVVHYQKYGYHPYVSEVAKMVRKGEINREEGLRRVRPPQANQLVMAISRQLNE